ncbi:MAG: hypothetical protein U0703_22090 [Anaerolineae bacterium]
MNSQRQMMPTTTGLITCGMNKPLRKITMPRSRERVISEVRNSPIRMGMMV